MVEILHPGVYVEELPTQGRSIEGVPTSTAGFVGSGSRGRADAVLVTSFVEFERDIGAGTTGFLPLAVRGFFDNGGRRCYVAIGSGADPLEEGLEILDREKFSILCCPDEHEFAGAAAKLIAFAERRKDVISILQAALLPDVPDAPAIQSSYAACYYPWLVVAGRDGSGKVTVPPAGHVAGVYARVDAERGVHHAPTGIPLHGVVGLSREAATGEMDSMIDKGINPLRTVPGRGMVIWGARTISSDPDFKYVNVRRLLIFLEHSIDRGIQWAVYEPNSPTLWIGVANAIQNFLVTQWRAGVLMGSTAGEAFFVRCDSTTMTQEDLDAGRFSVIVGVAPVRPAEFVLIRFTVQTKNGPDP